MLGQIPSLPNNSLPRILFLSIFFFSRFVSSHNRKHIKLCRPMYLCRTRMPILKTVSNVYFKIKMNSEKPGPAVPLQYPRQGCTPCPAPASGKMVVHSCTIFLCCFDDEITQGGDPLYAVFFLHRAREAILDQNECVFLQKTTVQGVNPRKKINFGEKNHFCGPGRLFFVTFGAFPKIRIVCQK